MPIAIANGPPGPIDTLRVWRLAPLALGKVPRSGRLEKSPWRGIKQAVEAAEIANPIRQYSVPEI